MAKKDRDVETPAEEVSVEEVPVEEVSATDESQELATTKQEDVAAVRVTQALDKLVTAVGDLSEENQTGIRVLAETLNPSQEGFGEIEEVRYRPPVVKVRQPVTTSAPERAKNGDLYSQDTGDVFDKPLLFVPIYPYENRARFQPGEMKPDCRSEDCKTSIYGDDCSKCGDRPWRDGKKQKCNNSFNIIAASPDFSRMYHLQFSKTSMKVGSSVIKQTRNAGQKPWQRVYGLGSKQETGGQGPYYTLTASFVEQVDPVFYATGNALHDLLGEQRAQAKAAAASRLAERQGTVDNLDDDIGDDGDGAASSSKGDFTDL